jgi:phosphatidylserine/phosphatidylglycerophosphate/cardiolipin synthase-like enzyme
MRLKNTIPIFLFLFSVFGLFAQQTGTISGSSFDLGFSPGETSIGVIYKAIRSAKSELLIACYEFTNRDIAEEVEKAAHRGVKVKIVADWKAAQGKYSQIRILSGVGIPVRLNHKYSIQHNKFMVIDGASVETGSFNYSSNAVRHNAENVLVLWNVPEIAKGYSNEWARLWAESEASEAVTPTKKK